MENNFMNWLCNNAQFSTDEIMPVLEEKISSMMGEEYQIDFFITNMGESSSMLDVYYCAFPKKEATSYVKAIFVYDDFIYEYLKEDEKHEKLRKVSVSKYNIDGVDFKTELDNQHSNTILIGKEMIKVEDALAYLLLPHKPKYHLFNDFFCYGKELDQIEETIVEFAKQKVHTEK